MGIGYFPAPHSDELLYSVCARFSSRVGYPSAASILEELLGARNARATVALPSRIGYLTAALPAGSALTADRLIEKHTLFPFFSSFLPAERVRRLREDMTSGTGQAAFLRSGALAIHIPMPDCLKYCPACVADDGQHFRETYWRRAHQLPGVEVCHLHQVFLEKSNVSLRAKRQHYLFIPAELATLTTSITRVDPANEEHQILLMIARDASRLLVQTHLCTNLGALYRRYLKLLIDRGLAAYSGGIHVTDLLEEFGRYYPPALLKRLHCGFTGSDRVMTNWLLRLVRKPKYAQHPLYHLLLIQFLGCTAEEFFQIPDELGFFGEGPWPCLNPAAEHYKEPVIQECLRAARLQNSRPIGTFRCACGFSYVRSGPDTSPNDRFRVGRMISFGQIWEAKLKELWEDSSLSLSEVGRRLGVDPLTVRKYAVKLKLSFTRGGRRFKPLKPATRLKSKSLLTARQKKLRSCRSKWLSVMRQDPKASLKVLRRKLPREYGWLYQNDPEWLEGHKPYTRRHTPSSNSVDWKRRDAEYAIAVTDAASSLKDTTGRPVRVTKNAIANVIGAGALLKLSLHKMPLTAQAIASVVETREQYAIRRKLRAA